MVYPGSREVGQRPRGPNPHGKKRYGHASGSESARPASLYRFVDVASFTEDWSDRGLEDEALRELEDAIARNPTRAPVVPGGGGARKIRRPDPGSGKGKSGGFRVLDSFLPDHGTVLLLAAWPKSEREDLEPQDYRAIGKVIARIQKLLDEEKIR